MTRFYRFTALLILIMWSLALSSASAQTDAKSTMAKITIKDKHNRPIRGVQVFDQDNHVWATSNNAGELFWNIVPEFNYRIVGKGYFTKYYSQVGSDTLIVLETDIAKRDELIDMGFNQQARIGLTSAYSTVNGHDLENVPSANFSQLLIGRLSGLITIEQNSELSKAVVNKYNRGVSSINGNQPTVVIDGVVCANNDFEFVSAKEIENVTFLKDAAATAIYGLQGANGVLLITTKSGSQGPLKVSVYYDHSIQQMSHSPMFFESYEYAKMRHEAWNNDGSKGAPPFSASQLKNYLDGDKLYFPSNNYYDLFIKKFSRMDRAGINVSGGNRDVRYFTNINYMHQGSPFILDDAQTKYDATPQSNWFNFRSKVDLKITDMISGFVNVFGNFRRETTAGNKSNSYIYNKVFSLPPTMFGPTTLGNDFGGEVVTSNSENEPVYGLLNRSGYASLSGLNVVVNPGLKVDLDFFAKGLSLDGSISYYTRSDRYQNAFQTFERYVGRYDESNMLLFDQKGSELNTPLVNSVDGSFEYNISYYGKVNYQRHLGKHSFQVFAYNFYRNQRKKKPETYETPSVLLPYVRHSLGSDLTYGYDKKYFLRFDAGYSGSDQFSPANRYSFTPAISAAWVVSNEKFMNSLNWLNFLKIRASYGKTANDEFDSGGNRFTYMDYVNTRGNVKMFANPNLKAELTTSQNIGLDFSVFNQFSINIDYFNKKVDNMLIDGGSINPSFSGISSSAYPKINSGVMENKGLEIAATYMAKGNYNWKYSINASYVMARNKILEIGEITRPQGEGKYAYSHRSTGYPLGQAFGYLIDYSKNGGYISNQDELNKYIPMYEKGGLGTPRLGDFMYRDLNNDGMISDMDLAPIGNGTIPIHYAFLGGNVSFKSIELDLLFQGAFGVRSDIGLHSDANNEGVYLDIHKNRWSQSAVQNGRKIEYPALAYKTNSTSMHTNDYNMVDCSYIRMRDITLRYTLPDNWSKKMKAELVKISLTGNNLFTFDRLPTNNIDPETRSLRQFQVYRVFNFGLNVTF